MSISKQAYAVAADLILVVHGLIALFAVAGAILACIEPRIVWLHLPVVIWSGLVNLAHWTCPLTPLEQHLREAAGQKAYEGGWIQHYLEPLVRPLGMPRRMELVAGFSVLIWNLLLYGMLWLLLGTD